MKIHEVLDLLRRFPQNGEVEVNHGGLYVVVEESVYPFDTPANDLPWLEGIILPEK